MDWDIITSIVVPIVIAYITSILTSRTDKKKIGNLEQIVSNSKEQIAKLELMLSKSDVQILELHKSIELQSQQLAQLKNLNSLQKESNENDQKFELSRLEKELSEVNAEIKKLKQPTITYATIDGHRNVFEEMDRIEELTSIKERLESQINSLKEELQQKGGLV